MDFVEKKFEQLTVDELYAALRLRCDVFVVEQACAYPELDGKDQHCQHLLGWSSAESSTPRVLAAYCRWYEDGADTVLGRIVTSARYRGQGLGRLLMREALHRIGSGPIRMHAQVQLEGFYGEFGFVASGEPFDEDGIDHLLMRRESAADAVES